VVRYRLGLTGGIGSGKSTVGALLEQRGALLIDADQLARAVVAPGEPALAEIVDRWGAGMLLADGSLNRAALAAVVFADPAERAALEAMTHPRIVARSEALLASSDSIVGVHMAALLLEAGAADRCDGIWLVTAPEEVRIRRVVARDGVEPTAVQARMQSQWPDSKKQALVDVVIDTDCSLDELEERVDAAWSLLLAAIAEGRPAYPPRSADAVST